MKINTTMIYFLKKFRIKINECFYIINVTFLEELMLIKQVHQSSVFFATIGIS